MDIIHQTLREKHLLPLYKLLYHVRIDTNVYANNQTVTLATQGLSRMVAALGHLSIQEPLEPSRLVRLPSSDTYLVSDGTMVFAPALSLGAFVRQGNTVGHGHFLDRVDCKPRTYTAPHDGWAICLAGQGLTRRGDVIAIVAGSVQ